MYCFNCNKKIKLEYEKVGFRSFCPFCGFDLHICKNCKFYSPGKPHDCIIPNIEHVIDKEKNNFCDDFKANDKPFKKKHSSGDEISQKLFKEKPEKKKNFDSLFDD